MALFDRFRKNGNQSVLPDEVRQYYQTEQRQRRGIAVVFAFVALIITILIASALFFGGRAIYRSTKHDDKKVTTQGQGGQTSSASTNTPNDTSKNKSNTTAPTPTTKSTPQPSTNTPAAQPTPAPASAPTTALPHTGDEGM